MPINFRSLDALRGALAIYVLFGHSRWLLWAGHAQWSQHDHPAWAWALAYASALLRFGHEAVLVFFVLSGFFIHLRAAGQLEEGACHSFNLGEYVRRRFHRLAAPYFFALLLTVATDAVGHAFFPKLYEAATGDALLDENFASKGYSPTSVIPALVMLPSSLGKDFGSNGPLWALSFEVMFYLAYPAWLALRRIHAGLGFGLVPLICGFAWALPDSFFFKAVITHYPIWLAGAALAELSVSGARLPRSPLWGMAGFALAFGAYVMLQRVNVTLSMLLGAAFGVAAVLAFGQLPAQARSSRWHRLMEFFGTRSYTIYVVQAPLLTLLCAGLIQNFGGRPMSGWVALLGGCAVLLIGVACFEVCEKRFIHARIQIDSPVQPA